MKWRNNAVELRCYPLFEEGCFELFLVEHVNRKHLDDALKSLLAKAIFMGYDAVSQCNGLAKQLLIEVDGHQTARQGIFGIEQTHGDMLRRHVEILPQNAVIKQQLHVVILQLVAAK